MSHDIGSDGHSYQVSAASSPCLFLRSGLPALCPDHPAI
jgi:hypothetical protein